MLIDKYVAEYEGGNAVWYAVKGKQRFRMPDCYKEMYNDHYLAIEKKEFDEMSAMLNSVAPGAHYIPLRTSA